MTVHIEKKKCSECGKEDSPHNKKRNKCVYCYLKERISVVRTWTEDQKRQGSTKLQNAKTSTLNRLVINEIKELFGETEVDKYKLAYEELIQNCDFSCPNDASFYQSFLERVNDVLTNDQDNLSTIIEAIGLDKVKKLFQKTKEICEESLRKIESDGDTDNTNLASLIQEQKNLLQQVHQKLNKSQNKDDSSSSSSPDNKGLIIFLVVSSLIGVAVGFGGWMWYRNRKSKKLLARERSKKDFN